MTEKIDCWWGYVDFDVVLICFGGARLAGLVQSAVAHRAACCESENLHEYSQMRSSIHALFLCRSMCTRWL